MKPIRTRNAHSPGHGRSPVARRLLAAAVLAAVLPALPARAQPLHQRTPNLEGTWVGTPHQLFFQFSHRFQVAGEDADIGDLFGDGKVVNYPTFVFNYGLVPGASVGARYSSNSAVAGQANEWQPYVKLSSYRGGEPPPLSVSALAAWNAANESFDGELAVQGRLRPLTLMGAVRGFSSPFDRPAGERESELAVAGGAALALNRYLTAGGDYGIMLTQPDVQVAWSAGVAARIPYTPHTLGIFATNVTSGTLQGLSVGRDGTTYWGFEFSVALSGHRWGRIFAPGADRRTPPSSPAVPPPTEEQREAAGPVVVVEIAEMAFGRPELEVSAGTTVRWVNRDPVPHTTTSTDGIWESPLLAEGESFEHTFDEPGDYDYYCAPHPFMKGIVRVLGEDATP